MTAGEARAFQNVGTFEISGLEPKLRRMLSDAIGGRRTLLDHGCGYGGWMRYFLALNRDFRFRAFDPDKAAEEFTRNLAPERHDAALTKFDAIVCFGVLELLSEAEQAALLKEFESQLEPGGCLLVQYNVFNILAPRWLFFTIMGKGNAKAFHQKVRFNRSYLSSEQVERLFHEAGFKVTECRTNKFWHKLPRPLNDALLAILRSRRFHSQLFYRLERLG